MYAFLSNRSACEALRHLADEASQQRRWPREPRKLPRWGDCVSTQREFARFARTIDLSSYGVCNSPVDLLVPDAARLSRGKCAKFHVWKNTIPKEAFLMAAENLFVSTPEFILVQMAGRNLKVDQVMEDFQPELRAAQEVQSMIDASQGTLYDDPLAWTRKEQILSMVLTICEFTGTYRLAAGDWGTRYNLSVLSNRNQFRAFAAGIPHLYGGNRVQAALDFSFDRSASPMETALALMLTLPVKYGGYGLSKPSLNEELPTGEFASLWDGGDHITPDLLWKDSKLVIEYESDEFHGLRGPLKATDDATRANVLSAMGYTVLRATTGSVTSQVALNRLAHQVAIVLGIALEEPDDLTLLRRHKLHVLLVNH